jgi:hypothetical protein
VKKVILSRRFNPEAIAALSRDFPLVIAEEQKLILMQAVKANPDAAAVIPFLSDRVDPG